MMEPRLQALIDLWSRSLEGGLDHAAKAELDALLADAPLVEAFGQWQAARSANEPEPSQDTPGLDARVMDSFRRRNTMKKAGPWLLGAMALCGGLGVLTWFAGDDAKVTVLKEDMRPLAMEEAQAEPKPSPAKAAKPLGLPPGYGSRPTRLEQRVGRSVQLSWRLTSPGEAKVQVLNAGGAVVRTLFQGKASAGHYSQAWDGRDGEGKPLSPGSYRLVAKADGKEMAVRDVELGAAPKQ